MFVPESPPPVPDNTRVTEPASPMAMPVILRRLTFSCMNTADRANVHIGSVEVQIAASTGELNAMPLT